jgi:hypothetical protein
MTFRHKQLHFGNVKRSYRLSRQTSAAAARISHMRDDVNLYDSANGYLADPLGAGLRETSR